MTVIEGRPKNDVEVVYQEVSKHSLKDSLLAEGTTQPTNLELKT